MIESLFATVEADTPRKDECSWRLQGSHYVFTREKLAGLEGAHASTALMTSGGEFFVSVSQHNGTGLFELNSGRTMVFDAENFIDASDIFETRSGRVYYAYLNRESLQVFDAHSGKVMLDVPFSGIPELQLLYPQLGAASPMYRPLFYETASHGVWIALVPKNSELSLEPAFGVPLVSVQLRTGKVIADHIHSGIFRYMRMPNSHVYALGWERNWGGYPNTLLVRDLSTAKDVLREEFGHTQDPPIITGQLSMFFNAKGEPELVMKVQNSKGHVYVFDRGQRRFVPLASLARVSVGSVQFFSDGYGKPWFAAAEASEFGRLLVGHFSLVLQPLEAIIGAVTEELTLAHSGNEVRELEAIRGPDDYLILAWERTLSHGKNGYAQLHIYDQSTQKLDVVALPEDWQGVSLRKSFWNPQTKTIVSYFERDPGEGSYVEFAQIVRK